MGQHQCLRASKIMRTLVADAEATNRLHSLPCDRSGLFISRGEDGGLIDSVSTKKRPHPDRKDTTRPTPATSARLTGELDNRGEFSSPELVGIGMSSRKRPASLCASAEGAGIANNSTEPSTRVGDNTSRPHPESLPTKKRRTVTFCASTKKTHEDEKARSRVSGDGTRLPRHHRIMKLAQSCTSLPELASSMPSSDDLLVSESATGELDLTVSPATFVKTILLQSKSSTGAIRGNDIISDASKRVSSDSYFLTYTPKHLEAYTTDKVNAVQTNDINKLRALLYSGEIMQASNRFGESMLHTSCRRGFTSIVQFFIQEAEVDVRVRDDMGRTPMHDACWSSSPPNHEIMKLLICSAPELLLSKDKRGHSPFDYARREHWPNWVTFLNEHRQFIVNSLVCSCLEKSEEFRKESQTQIHIDFSNQ